MSIKGTRFLVVAEERAEVAVFHGTVGLHRDSQPARELLVREGFAAIGEHGRPFELLWSGAPDPWNAWSEGGLPPRAPEPAPSASAQTEALIDAAKAAAHERSRSAAVEQAVDRHPKLADRLAEVVSTGDGSETGDVLGVSGRAPIPIPTDPSGRPARADASAGGVLRRGAAERRTPAAVRSSR